MSWALAFSRAEIKPPAVHWALNSPFTIYIATDERAVAMGAAVFDGKDCPVNIEEGNLDVVDFYELTFSWWKCIYCADYNPPMLWMISERGRPRRWHNLARACSYGR